jgi:hypothetical protein
LTHINGTILKEHPQFKSTRVGIKPFKSSPLIVEQKMLLIALESVIILILHIISSHPTEAHGTLLDPISRNSLWRVDFKAPKNYNDIEMFCGGIGVITQTGGKCGVCGDPYTAQRPRPHETGGYMTMNKTVKNYFPGSTIDVLVDLDTNHGGYFEFELCRRDSFDIIETDECFEKLQFVDGTYRRRLKNSHSEKGLISLSLVVPKDLTDCPACILRWNYRAGNNWGICQDGSSATGCGPQELYRNCADISIGYRVPN